MQQIRESKLPNLRVHRRRAAVTRAEMFDTQSRIRRGLPAAARRRALHRRMAGGTPGQQYGAMRDAETMRPNQLSHDGRAGFPL